MFDCKFLEFQEAIHDEEFWKKHHFIFFDFVCKTKGARVQLNSEGQEYVWVKPKDALKLPLAAYTKRAIEEYLRKSA